MFSAEKPASPRRFRRAARLVTWPLLLSLVASSLTPTLAFAQPKPAKKPATAPAGPPAPAPLSTTLTGMAKAEYEAGKVLFSDKDYANAIVKFQKAYELSNDPRLLWNVAVCQKFLRRYSKMLLTLRKLLADGGDLLTEQDRKDADELAKTVETFVSRIAVTVNEPGAKVLVDGELIASSPLAEPFLIDVGTRKIRVEKPGFVPYDAPLEVTGGGDVTLDVKLVKEIHEGRLVIVTAPENIISIDGKVVGQGGFDGVLPSGGHALRISAPGMQTYQGEVVISDNKLRRVPITLNPVARDMTETILWIAGGVVLTAGAVVGGVFLFQPSEKDKVEGSIEPGLVQLGFGGRR